MPDATLNVPEADPVSSIDVRAMHIYPADKQVLVELDFRRASGAIARTVTERFDVHDVDGLPVDDFTPCMASFCQATPKKKLLQFIVARGRLSGVTVS